MENGALKREIRERILDYQYHKDTENIWELLDAYDKQLAIEHTKDELAEAAFFRGEAAFQNGRYSTAVNALTKCLGIEKTKKYAYLEVQAYNMLGTLLSFVGYEASAMLNYLEAEKAAEKNRDTNERVVILLNEGLLYQGLREYRKALNCYQRGYDLASSNYAKPDIRLVLISLIQKAQMLCRMERFDEAKKMKREIDSYCHVASPNEFLLPKGILEVYLEEYFGTEESTEDRIGRVRAFLEQDEEYLEQIDSYLDFCYYLMERDKKEVKGFLDVLRERLRVTDYIHLRMELEELEVAYQKKFEGEDAYLKACRDYMEEQREYERALKLFRRQNISKLGELQQIREERQKYEMMGKHDFATGFLNKETFQDEVEQYLSEKKRNVMDVFILIDIDDLKLINDRYGNFVSDEMIAALAKLLKKNFAEKGICGRFGGDEFAVFIENVEDIEQIEMKIEDLREYFSEIGFGKKEDVHNTVSIGVSYNRGIDTSFRTMFSCADEALLKVKEYGKNRVAFFEIKRGLLKYVE